MAIWKIDELGEFVTLKRGYDLPQQKRKNGEIPIFSSSGVTGTHNEAMVEAPGVITGRYGTIGEVFFAETSFWPLNTTLYVENFHENDEKFVYYFLKTLEWKNLHQQVQFLESTETLCTKKLFVFQILKHSRRLHLFYQR